MDNEQSNQEKWRLLTREFPSPQSYIEFGWTYLIAAALQRRVWCGPSHRPLFPNQYVTLVGEPGIGKGWITHIVSEFLRHHKMINPDEKGTIPSQVKQDLDPNKVSAAATLNYEKSTEENKNPKDKLIIPIAADAITYQALAHATARATRYINYKKYDELTKAYTKTGTYAHASICFCNDELSSLFREKTNDVVNFLVKTYDAGDYDYETKTQGVAKIRSCCVNMLSGTQPDFLQTAFSDRLVGQGYTSRLWFIFEWEPRFKTLKYPELDAEQLSVKQSLLQHILKLTRLYGPVKFTEEAENNLEDWWKNESIANRPNPSDKLKHYYSRKDIHTRKLAMALHFGEDAEMDLETGYPKNEITWPTCVRAMDMLGEAEKKMHYAINFDSKNPLSVLSKKIFNFIKIKGPQSRLDLKMELYDDGNDKDRDEALTHLIATSKIALYNIKFGTNGEPTKKKYDIVLLEGDSWKERYSREPITT